MMDLILSWLCSAFAKLLEEIAEFFTGLFGYDITTFNNTFSFAATAYDIICKTALALALVLAAWQVIVFFTKGAEKAPATPIRAALNAVIAVAFIFYGNYIFEAILDFCQYPFDALNNTDAVEGGLFGALSINSLIKDRFAEYSMLFYFVMLVLIGFSYVKLLLEIVERYVVAFVLVYLSPLAAATLASNTTSGIYKKFFTMFISQCLLLFLNVWCLKMAVSGLDLSRAGQNDPVIAFLLCYAFLRVSAKMDSYINQLGLNAAITGGGLGAEIFAAGHSLLGGGSGGGNGAGGGVGNKVLGASKTVQTWANRYNPATAIMKGLQDTVVGGVKGTSEAFRSGAVKNANGKWNKTKAALKGFGDGVSHEVMASDGGFGIRFTRKGRNQLKDRFVKKYTPATTADGHTDEQIAAETAQYNTQRERDISTVSSNSHIANEIYSRAKDSPDYGIPDGADQSQEVAAVIKGLGFTNLSAEQSDFIQAGFGTKDGAQDLHYSLDQNGIHARYDHNGARHKWDIVDKEQYKKLSTQEREGYQKTPTADGRTYYTKNSKTVFEKPQKDKGSEDSGEKKASDNQQSSDKNTAT